MPRNFPRLPHTDPAYNLLQAVERRLPTFMAGRQRTDAFLECGAAIDSLHSILSAELPRVPAVLSAAAAAAALAPAPMTPPLQFQKIEIGVLRNDTPSGTDGSHWGLLLKVGQYFLLIDPTWLQFEIPYREKNGDYQYLLTHHGHLLSGYLPFVSHGTTREEAISEWKSFLVRLKYVTAVRHPEFHDARNKAAS